MLYKIFGYFVTTLVLIGLIGMVIFGVVLMEHSMMYHGNCVASTITGSPCPDSRIGIFFHHIAAMQMFIISFPPVFSSLLLFTILFSLAVSAFYTYLARPLAYFRITRRELSKPFSRYKFNHWLALHENSPTLI